MSRFNEIENYYKEYYKEISEEEFYYLKTHSVYLAMIICNYAHRNQKRDNNERYFNHPLRCMYNYRKLLGFERADNFDCDTDLIYEHNIPYDGVQEVCLLHDVIEDTDFTLQDIKEIFNENDFELYFKTYIEEPLKLITHDKSIDYLDYLNQCTLNPISALVKMMDLQDNLYVITLKDLSDDNFKRAGDYLTYIYLLNKRFHFIENANKFILDNLNK